MIGFINKNEELRNERIIEKRSQGKVKKKKVYKIEDAHKCQPKALLVILQAYAVINVGNIFYISYLMLIFIYQRNLYAFVCNCAAECVCVAFYWL